MQLKKQPILRTIQPIRLPLLLIAAILLWSGCKKDSRVNWRNSQAREKIELKFNPPAGKQMKGDLDMKSKVELLFLGQRLETEADLDALYLVNSKGKNANGFYEMEMEVNQVELQLTLPDMANMDPIHYNSEEVGSSDESKTIDSYVRDYIDKPINLQFDDQAAVRKIGDLDKAIAAMNDDERAEVQDAFERIMGDDLIEKFINFSAILPDKPVKLGDSWNNQVETTIAGVPLNMDNELTLIDRKDGLSEIAIKSKLAVDTIRLNTEGIGGFSEMPGDMEGNISDFTRVVIKGDQTGNIFVDESTGITRESHLTQEIKMEIKIALLTAPVTVYNQIDFTPAD